MTSYDFAVKRDGELFRFVSSGDKAAIFHKDGTMEHLIVTGKATGMRAPKVTNQDGEVVTLSRVAKPCSCKGGVWKKRPSELVAQL